MSAIERIVRPFQFGDVFTARVLPPSPPAVAPNADTAHLEWTGTADSTYVTAPDPSAAGFKVKWIEDPSRRVTDTVRLTNQDDPDQFVDIQRIRQMVIKNDHTGEEININPTWTGHT